jgi:hypothetical protein
MKHSIYRVRFFKSKEIGTYDAAGHVWYFFLNQMGAISFQPSSDNARKRLSNFVVLNVAFQMETVLCSMGRKMNEIKECDCWEVEISELNQSA